jgi:hypothetical protein
MGDSGAYRFFRGGTYHYSLVITGANGCMSTYQDSVSIPSFPGISLPFDTNVCTNTSMTIKATPSNGTPPYTIWWGRISQNITGLSITPTIHKDTAFAVHISDANGCTNYDSMYIKAIPLPDAHWFMNYIGNEAYFHAIDSSQSGNGYSWAFGDGGVATIHSPKHKYAQRSSYTISLVVSDDGCSGKYDSTINIINAGIETGTTDNFSLSLYPNPFASFTTIQYTLSQKSNIQIIIYDMEGTKRRSRGCIKKRSIPKNILFVPGFTC